MKAEQKLMLIQNFLDSANEEFSDEDILHMLLEKKISAEVEPAMKEHPSFAQRSADLIARFAGSWTFIILFTGFLLGWMAVNTVLSARAFDSYPYILLNLVLSCVAAVQAPLIMMSQNRQEQKDRLRAENDYKVNLKSEFIVEDLHKKIDYLIENQLTLLETLKEL